VESLIFFLTLLIAIFDLFAFTNYLENVSGATPLTDTDRQFFSNSKFEGKKVFFLFFKLDNDKRFIREGSNIS